jgi:Ca2+-binding RTX toxin-like protein
MKRATTRRGVLLLASMLVAIVVSAGVALAATINCSGGGALCRGTTVADNISGSTGKDSIFAYGGSDLVAADLGADRIRGAAGNDTIGDGPIRDQSYDVIIAGTGNDKVNTNNTPGRRDYIDCGAGRDTLIADRGIDRQRGCERIFVR